MAEITSERIAEVAQGVLRRWNDAHDTEPPSLCELAEWAIRVGLREMREVAAQVGETWATEHRHPAVIPEAIRAIRIEGER